MKKFLAMLLALAMVFALAACGETAPAPAQTDTTDQNFQKFHGSHLSFLLDFSITGTKTALFTLLLFPP